MKLIGLTGGIGAGKSTIARRFSELGAIVIDADQVARDVVAPGEPALDKIFSIFGRNLRHQDGSLDRSALGSIVFSDPVQLQLLNSIVHPAVKERTKSLFSQAPSNSVVVYDVPLLVDASVDYPFDIVVVASAPESIRIKRLMEHRGMTQSEAQTRIDAQVSEEDRLKIADVVIDTGGEISHTFAQVDALWRQVINVD